MTRRTRGEMSAEELIRELEVRDRDLREARERLLEEASSRYSDLYDLAPVGYCTLNPEGRILELNLTAATLLGAPRETLVGRPFQSVAPLTDKRSFQAHLRLCQRNRARVTSELAFGSGKAGTRSVQIVSDPGQEQGGTTIFRTMLIDISDLKAMERRLRILSAAGQALTSSLEYAATIEAAARTAVPGLSDVCLIDLASERGAVERVAVLFADPQKQATLAEPFLHFTSRPGWETPQDRVVASGEPMLLADMSADPGDQSPCDAPEADALRAAGIRSLLVVPLIARGRRFGALTLAYAESDRRYSSPDLPVAEDLASLVAMAVDNARLYDATQAANQALRVSEAKASGIVSISADAIVSIDDDQRITLFNEGAERIFGYSKAEAIGAPLAVLIPERFRELHRQHVARFAADGETARRMGGVAIVGLRKSGEEFPADAAISRLEVGGVRVLTVALRDVTEQKRIESDQRFLAEMGSVLAATLDFAETLTSIAQLAVRAFADFCIVDIVEDDGVMRRTRVVGRDPSRQWVCDAVSQFGIDWSRPNQVTSTLRTKRPVLIEEVTPELMGSWAQSDEHARVLRGLDVRSIIAVPLLARGELLGILKFLSSTPGRAYGQADLRLAEDIGNRAALAIENARLYRVAERAIRARDEVLGVVAHDLRNPLGNIMLQATLLRRTASPRHWSIEPVEAIQRAAKRMSRLLQDLLDVTRIDAGHLSVERTRVAAGGAVSELFEAQRPLVSAASLELRLDVASDPGEVFADRERLFQILENLVSNAVRSTPPGGRITVGAAPTAGEVLFWVADTGAGIEASDLPHLFDRFWQARKVGTRQGAGLGLPIVRGLVEAQGGRVWVESQVGVGSTFFFTLPRAPPAQTDLVTGDGAAGEP